MMMMMQSLPSSVGGNMKTAAHHRGSLKQQCIDEHGLYTWQKKDFLLYIDQGKLDIRSPGDGEDDLLASTATVSLQGARYAKEWSFSSALAGYGFDILWVSGKIWSFLVDNEADCLQWVGVLNQAIQRCNEDFGHVPSALPVASTTTTAGSPEAAMSPSRPGQSKPKATYESHKEYLSHLASSQSYGTNEDDTRNISFSTAPQLGLSVDTTTANFSHNNNNLYRSRSQSPSHHRNPNESILLNTMPISGKNRYREVNEDEAISGVAMRASRDFYDDMPRLNVMASPPPPPPNSYSSVDAAATAHNFSMMMNISEIPRSNQSQIDSGSETGSIQPPYNTATNNYMPPLSSKKSSLTGYDTIPASPKAGIPKVTTTDNTPRSSGEYVEHMKSIFANTKQTLYNAEQSLHQYPPLASTRLMPASSVQSSSMDAQINAEIAWQIKCGQLEQMLQEREGNYHQLEDDFQSMQQDYQQQIQSLQQQLTVVQQREQAISEVSPLQCTISNLV